MSFAATLRSRQLVQTRSSSVRAVPVPRGRLTSVIVRAEEQAEGYVEKDSAGQTNMYPSVTRPFAAGSSADTVDSQGAITGIAAAAVAGAAIFLGLTALNAGLSSGPSVVADGDYEALSAYASKFSSELGLRKPKPAPPVEVEAPAPVAAEAPAAEEAPVA